MNIKHILPLLWSIAIPYLIQSQTFTQRDTLMGSITPDRAWWDLSYYHLAINVDPADSTISGSNTIVYKVLQPGTKIQIDLQKPLHITKVEQEGQALNFNRVENAYFINLKKQQKIGSIETLKVYYDGKPRIAVNPPWQGGVSWKKDNNGMPFVATSCQSIGSSVWWPGKDHPADEPDSVLLSITVPEELVDVSNGRLPQNQ